MDAFTAKNWQFDKAPAKVKLYGDKKIKSEPAQHIIEFPGGAIEVSRTSDGEYWAHITINQGQVVEDAVGRESAIGDVVRTRYQTVNSSAIERLPNESGITQLSVLIRPTIPVVS